MKIKLLIGASILLLASSVQASTIRTAITISGMDWAQLNDTNQLPGVEVYALCALSATCNGVTQSGIDLTGWIWAEKEQAVGLVNDVLGTSWDGTSDLAVDTSKWFDYIDYSLGGTSLPVSFGIYKQYNTIELRELLIQHCNPIFDLCDDLLREKSVSDNELKWWFGIDAEKFDGYFLYRPTVVPIPAAAWLFGTALIGLVGFSRRRKAT